MSHPDNDLIADRIMDHLSSISVNELLEEAKDYGVFEDPALLEKIEELLFAKKYDEALEVGEL